ncbi:hypothetical protein HMPREF0373_01140 [Eubacterium ramulus ATCC 29099]|uniref:Uncharacterized protein n=1 Tax=Eubacterium ramulus ATCC 29099 TaxID=1256908 RepID=U2R746_EUBRA|nr:hypothetical protein HMPREF0373_01140 [Eubacterium ramulus ATCC 29099]
MNSKNIKEIFKIKERFFIWKKCFMTYPEYLHLYVKTVIIRKQEK